MTFRTIALLLALGLLACGGGGGGETGGGGEEGSGGEDDLSLDGDDDFEAGTEHREGASAIEQLGISGPDTPWDSMSDDEKEFYMVGKVLPIMQELFRQHDPERFANIGCETCHGPNMRENHFAMPSGHLLVVPPVGAPARDNMPNIFGDLVTFMEETVTPTMGTLLGEEGYSCAHCHPDGTGG